ncbi:DUF6809 family protein [Paenibacillus sp. MMS20-IR301]|uniref:DUF6809 family protein n=1 Tax=Paenibacillus sp. MMS20-IR301 TaxID=2895946 RepID=UPI0028E51A66|nr:DUF6809 family protein [Paenibacillus sp. MMS20-IR301]WNS44723.1 hypothetical protein LOS79_05460 [Paenibacillus sp. MMS20-IR301]
MKIILEDFYYEKLHPNELIKPNNPEILELSQKVMEASQQLKKNLTVQEFQKVEKFLDLQTELNALQAALSFIQGYKIGALKMIEVFSGESEAKE